MYEGADECSELLSSELSWYIGFPVAKRMEEYSGDGDGKAMSVSRLLGALERPLSRSTSFNGSVLGTLRE